MNAQLKPDRDGEIIRRLSAVHEIKYAKATESLKEELQDAVTLMAELILANFGAGDSAQNGTILDNAIFQLADGIRRGRIRRELQATADEMGAQSWEQAMENLTGKPARGPL